MKLKTNWIYNYKKGIKNPIVSEDYHMKGDKLYFMLCLGIRKWESVLIELDLKTQEFREIFKECNIARTCGIYKDDRVYLTTFSGKAYCVNLDGTIEWETKIGATCASFKLAIDEKHVYVSDYSFLALDKNTGEIIWKNETFNRKSNCNILCDERHIYSGELGGSIFCLDQSTGQVCWRYGEE